MLGSALNDLVFQDIRKAMEMLSLQQKPAKTTEEALQKQYQFWSTQPVPKMGKCRAGYLHICCSLAREKLPPTPKATLVPPPPPKQNKNVID